MTAAGTVKPARVLVLGAGVAGLQAIATARRLGAVVTGFDVRPAVKEQVESLGAQFLELDLGAADTETAGGYAKELDEDAHRREQELVTGAVADSDVVITTALIPGRAAPVLITEEAVAQMRTGSVIVDLAAEAGGNCALTEPGHIVERHGVTIIGTLNLPSTMAQHASQLYAKNVQSLVKLLAPEGALVVDLDGRDRARLARHVRGRGRQRPRRSADGGEPMSVDLITQLTVFALAVFVGFEVISKVPTMLHTPLMSGTNAIHGIVVVGAIIVVGEDLGGTLATVFGFIAVVFGTINVVGGFLVTDRMLQMFRRRPAEKEAK